MAEKGIQEKISWVSHPLLAEASEQMEKGQLDAAAASLQKLLLEKPDSIDAYRMLQRIYWQKNDLPAHRDALAKLLGLEIKANDHEGAMQTCQDFRNAGGEKLPASLWLEFCRQLETQPDISRAADEYLELAQAYPAEKQGLLAQMAAGRIYLKRLNRPADALRLYEAAAGFVDSARGLANHHRARHRRSEENDAAAGAVLSFRPPVVLRLDFKTDQVQVAHRFLACEGFGACSLNPCTQPKSCATNAIGFACDGARA